MTAETAGTSPNSEAETVPLCLAKLRLLSQQLFLKAKIQPGLPGPCISTKETCCKKCHACCLLGKEFTKFYPGIANWLPTIDWQTGGIYPDCECGEKPNKNVSKMSSNKSSGKLLQVHQGSQHFLQTMSSRDTSGSTSCCWSTWETRSCYILHVDSLPEFNANSTQHRTAQVVKTHPKYNMHTSSRICVYTYII